MIGELFYRFSAKACHSLTDNVSGLRDKSIEDLSEAFDNSSGVIGKFVFVFFRFFKVFESFFRLFENAIFAI